MKKLIFITSYILTITFSFSQIIDIDSELKNSKFVGEVILDSITVKNDYDKNFKQEYLSVTALFVRLKNKTDSAFKINLQNDGEGLPYYGNHNEIRTRGWPNPDIKDTFLLVLNERGYVSFLGYITIDSYGLWYPYMSDSLFLFKSKLKQRPIKNLSIHKPYYDKKTKSYCYYGGCYLKKDMLNKLSVK